jgi:hypothetical protein
MLENIRMDAFLTKPDAAEECPCRLVRCLGYCSDPLDAQLDEWILKHRPHGLRGSPVTSCSYKTDLYIWVPIMMENRRRCKRIIAYDADCCTRTPV